MATEDLADASTHAIAPDGASEASTGRDAVAVVIAAIGDETDGHEPIGPGAALPADTSEVFPSTECRHGPVPGPPAISS